MKKVRIVIIILLSLVAAYSAYRLADYGLKIYHSDKEDQKMLEFRPAIPEPQATAGSSAPEPGGAQGTGGAAEPSANLFEPILKMQKVNPDFIGWVNIYNTNIDFAFAQSKDNDYYLYKDINREYSISGTVFLDYRCKADFSSPVSILYGHHMKKAAKFTWLDAFAEASYLKEHRNMNILLADRYIRAEIFAYGLCRADSEAIFNSLDNEGAVLDYLKKNAAVYLEPALVDGGRIILLATCNYEISDGRAVVAAYVPPES